MIRAAGILFRAPDGKVLLLKRGAGSDHANTWGVPGGQARDLETAIETAERETMEEITLLPRGPRYEWTRTVSSALGSNPTGPSLEPEVVEAGVVPPPETSEQVEFTTFLQKTEDQFTPILNYEHDAWCWADPERPPEPLHPGTRIALARLSMDELGVARAMVAGDLVSPQRYNENLTLFALRITGTGLSFRSAVKEYVWRDKSIYMNEDFLARCNGLPVLWEHPEKTMLNTKEFGDRIIGTIMLPYFKGDDEVWGIAKILDGNAAKLMTNKQLSTSPGVVIKTDESSKLTMEDGKALLIEGKPILLDHLSVVAAGVWDKAGPPTGILNEVLERVDSMAEANEKDAAGNIDKLLSHLDAMKDSMNSWKDSVEKRFDEWEKEKKEEKDRKDAMKRDAEEKEEKERCDKFKKDAEEEDCSDADFEKKCDEFEKTCKDSVVGKSVISDAKARRDARKDAMKRDAESKKEEEEKKDSQRMSDDRLTRALREIDELKARITVSPNDKEFQDKDELITRIDEAYRAHGKQMLGLRPGESAHTFAKRNLRPFLPLVKNSKGEPKYASDDLIDKIPAELLMDTVDEVCRAAIKDSMSMEHLNEDDLVSTTRTSDSGHRITEWRGKHTVVRRFASPVTQYGRMGTASIQQRRA
jgi:8-oxo-dGTP pyrophosphatase MutT (NUDIX family)